MPPTLPINLANFPALRTRKALLMLDFQTDFVSPSGALPVSLPNGYVDRALDFAKSFRDSDSGDVIWIRSQFQGPRPRADAHIITSSVPAHPPVRGQRHPSPLPSTGDAEDGDGDDSQNASYEAFLTGAESESTQSTRQQLLLPGSPGAEMPPVVLSAVDARRDLVLTKSHYSAFEATQLLMRLRTRLITELYICGALTNISIYATALDAASHGLTVTLIEDCCGYRNIRRHDNALASIVQLTGCDILLAQDLLGSLPPPQPLSSGQPTDSFAAAIAAIAAASTGPPRARRPTKQSSTGPVGFTAAGNSGASIPVRTQLPKRSEDEGGAGGLEKDATGSKDTGEKDVVEEKKGEYETKEEGKKKEKTEDEGALRRLSFTAHTLPISVAKKARPLQPVVAGATSDLVYDSTLEDASPARGEADTGDSPPALLDALQAKRPEHSGQQPEGRPDDAEIHQEATKTSASGQTQQLPDSSNLQDSTEFLATSAATNPPDCETGMQSPSISGLESQAKPATGPGADANTDPTSFMDGNTSQGPIATEPICEGDTIVYHNVLPESIADGMYERLRDEVHWLRMSHNGGEVPRLICVQGDVSEDSIPIYRHPADESPPLEPFSPLVLQIKNEIERTVGHILNHVLIQLYRTGNDYISEHSDKTLDIVQDSFVCNLSLGAERTMIFRTKRVAKDPSRPRMLSAAEVETEGAEGEKAVGEKRETVRVQLPHNSLCRMGLRTNMRWLHAIRQDKRSDRDRAPEELAFGGGRISLTFRRIGTFLNHDQTVIWGQGAVAKTRKDARPVVNGQTDEAIRMLRAFGKENHSSVFDWGEHYGEGFDVLHMSNAPRFFTSADATVNLSIQLLLSDLDIAYAKGSMSRSPGTVARGGTDTGSAVSEMSWIDLPVRLVDNDSNRSTVSGLLAILLYLDKVYGRLRNHSPSEEALLFTRLQQALALLDKWKRTAHAFSGIDNPSPSSPVKAMKGELAVWESYITSEGEKPSLWPSHGAGNAEACLVDFVFWPSLHSMEQFLSGAAGSSNDASLSAELLRLGFPGLAKYYTEFGARESVLRVVSASKGRLEWDGFVPLV